MVEAGQNVRRQVTVGEGGEEVFLKHYMPSCLPLKRAFSLKGTF